MLPRLAPPSARPPPLHATVYSKLQDYQPPLVSEASSSSSHHQPVEDGDEAFAQVGADTDAEMGGWDWQEASLDLDQSAAVASPEQESVTPNKSAAVALEAGKPGGEFAKAGEKPQQMPDSSRRDSTGFHAADKLDCGPTPAGEPSLASPGAATSGDGGTTDARASAPQPCRQSLSTCAAGESLSGNSVLRECTPSYPFRKLQRGAIMQKRR